MTQNKRFTIVALALSAAWSPMSFAQDSPAAAQCNELIKEEKLSLAEPVCAKAADEPGKYGKMLYAYLLQSKGDPEGAYNAYELYSEIVKGVDPEKATDLERAALRNRAFIGLDIGSPYADRDAREALRIAPKDIELLKVAAQRVSDMEQRLQYADRLVALEPKSSEAHILRSFALIEAHKTEEALAAAETASNLDPKSATPLFARGAAYASAGDFAKAEREFSAAARKAPEEPAIKVNQAEMLAELKRFEDAIDVATDALKQSPNYPGALRIRASARLQMGDADGALADLDIANSVEPNFEGPDLRGSAEETQEAQKAMQPESVASMEQDREMFFAAVSAHLYRQCGRYTVSDDVTNEALDAYRDCIREWYKAGGDAVVKSLTAEVLKAVERFDQTARWVDKAQALQCSKMPKKSRCIPDSLVARAQAAKDLSDPRATVGKAEFARLNQEVDAYNARVSRNNALIHTSNFLNALAEALSQQ